MTIKTDKPKTLDSFLRKPDSAPATEAQRIRAMGNPYLSAVARCAYRRVLDSEKSPERQEGIFL